MTHDTKKFNSLTRVPLPSAVSDVRITDARYKGKVASPATRIPLPGNTINDRVTMVPKSAAADKATRRSVGAVLMGRYEILSELGQGGMGVVYRCLDRTGGVEVAVKGLPPEVSHDAAAMEDIRDNFQLVSDLRHPCIAGIRNLESDPATGDFYLVMDLVSGKNLHRWAKAHQDPGSRNRKLKIITEIASALDYAHERKIMHRDIKPENVMVDLDGHVKVLDFGLASQIRSSMSRVSLVTRSQSGTPSYKAPEQWRGQPQNAATDQYSLGVLAYELLAGYLPFDSEDMTILRMSVLSEPMAEISDMPSSVNAALARALAKNPAERFSSCGEFAKALASAAFVATSGNGPGNGRIAANNRESPVAQQEGKPKVAALVAGFVLLAAAIFGGGLYIKNRKQSSMPVAQPAVQSVARPVAQPQGKPSEAAGTDSKTDTPMNRERTAGNSGKEQTGKDVNSKKPAKTKEAQDANRNALLEKKLKEGYKIKDGPDGRKIAVWEEGNTIPEYPHWITSATENHWHIEDGYAKKDANGPIWSPVVWKPGLMKSKDLKAGEVEGTWLHRRTCPLCGGRKTETIYSDCKKCDGNGRVEYKVDCEKCQGKGKRTESRTCIACGRTGMTRELCKSCNGSGTQTCTACGGSGKETSEIGVLNNIGQIGLLIANKGKGNLSLSDMKSDCSECAGRGFKNCDACKGGKFKEVLCGSCYGRRTVQESVDCLICGGDGKITKYKNCQYCRNGRVEKSTKCKKCDVNGFIWEL